MWAILKGGAAVRLETPRPLQGIRGFWIQSAKTGYAVAPLDRVKGSVVKIVKPKKQASAPNPGPTLSVFLTRRVKRKRPVVFAAREPGSDNAWTTDVDLWSVPADGSAEPRCLTGENQAWDTAPCFSLDGRTLCYAAMQRPGFELVSPQDVSIPRCVDDADAAIAQVREHHARWRASAPQP